MKLSAQKFNESLKKEGRLYIWISGEALHIYDALFAAKDIKHVL